eukprot:SAG31_NODE_6774_length_1893_cov_9.920847_1_plen_257_part_00
MQEALDPSGTSTNRFLDGRSCFGSWGSGTDYCTWHERNDGGFVWGVLCGGCTASEEPDWFGDYDYLGCPMDSDNPTLVTYLDLNSCGLQGSLPWSLLGQLTRLQLLSLSHNPDLTGTALAEEGLAALTQLRYLSLYRSTQLSGTVPTAALGGLAQLRYLYLAGTQLSGTVPAAALGGLAQLRVLYLVGTQVDAAQCQSFCDAHASTVSPCTCQCAQEEGHCTTEPDCVCLSGTKTELHTTDGGTCWACRPQSGGGR